MHVGRAVFAVFAYNLFFQVGRRDFSIHPKLCHKYVIYRGLLLEKRKEVFQNIKNHIPQKMHLLNRHQLKQGLGIRAEILQLNGHYAKRHIEQDFAAPIADEA